MQVGDRFRIIVHDWDDTDAWAAYGVEGVLVESPRYDELYWIGELDSGRHGSFHAHHIEIIPQQVMKPDISLDEIHQFRELVERS